MGLPSFQDLCIPFGMEARAMKRVNFKLTLPLAMSTGLLQKGIGGGPEDPTISPYQFNTRDPHSSSNREHYLS